MLARRTTPARTAGRLRAAFTLVEVLVVMAIIVIIAGTGTIAALNFLAESRVKEAKIKASNIAKACESYKATHDSMWPTSLNELISPTDGSKPLLQGGDTAIIDPWGKNFNMQIVTDNFNVERAVISTTTDDGREVKWPEK